MGLTVSIIWRGPLASCNYSCTYCPFAKRRERPADKAADSAALQRFVNWVGARPTDDRLSILFMPWGEALVRKRYRDALAALSRLPQIRCVAIQTNLSCRPQWLDPIDRSRLALWTTWHPGETPREAFVARCRALHDRGIRFSAGMVGLIEQTDAAARLRAELPGDVYLWINARQDVRGYYDSPIGKAAVDRFTAIDPLFPLTLQPHRTAGRACGAGETVVSVDGEGTIRRCHFIRQPIGQLYERGGLERALAPRPCTRAACRCFTGFAHLPHLGLPELFGDGLLARIPATPLWRTDHDHRDDRDHRVGRDDRDTASNNSEKPRIPAAFR